MEHRKFLIVITLIALIFFSGLTLGFNIYNIFEPLKYEDNSKHTLEVHKGNVNTVSFSPDGFKLASSSYEGIRIWNSSDWNNIETIKISDPKTNLVTEGGVHSGDVVNTITWNPNGSMLIAGIETDLDNDKLSDMIIKVFNTTNWENVKIIIIEDEFRGRFAWSPDGLKLATANRKSIDIWNVSSWEIIKKINFSGYVNVISWSTDGKYLASGGLDGNVWNANNWEIIFNFYHVWGISSISFSPDNSFLISGGSGGEAFLKIWDTSNWQLIKVININGGNINSITWKSDSSKIAVGYFIYDDKWIDFPGMIKVIDTNNWNIVTILKGHWQESTTGIPSISWKQNSSILASGAEDTTIKIWDVENPSKHYLVDPNLVNDANANIYISLLIISGIFLFFTDIVLTFYVNKDAKYLNKKRKTVILLTIMCLFWAFIVFPVYLFSRNNNIKKDDLLLKWKRRIISIYLIHLLSFILYLILMLDMVTKVSIN